MSYKYAFNPLTQKLDRVSKNDPTIAVEYLGGITNDPTGYPNRSDSVISFNEGTRTFEVAPTGTSFDVFLKGKKVTISSPLSIQLPDVSSQYFIYINENGVLDYNTSFDLSILDSYAYTAFIIWSATQQEALVVGEERHGLSMDGATHGYLHTTRGTQLVSGGAINYSVGDGSLEADCQISLGDMRIADEDIVMTISHSDTPSAFFEQILSPVARIPMVYRAGTEWRRDVATDFPVKQGTARAQYNLFSGGTWSTVDAPLNNNIVVSYIFATNDIREPIVCFMGQDYYESLEDAQADAGWDRIDFGDIPFQEIKLLHVLFIETSSSYANTPSARIIAHRDVRLGTDRELSSLSQNTDHSNLSGLNGDDHPLYLNRTGIRPMEGALNMDGNSVINATTYNGVAVESHASRHLPNGADPLSTGTPVSIGSINSEGAAFAFSRADHIHAHGDQGGGSLHAVATTSVNGFMSATDKIKLDSLSLNPINVTEVIANNTISTTNGGFTAIPQMTITPAAGTYLLMFAANYALSGQASAEIMMYIAGGAQSNTLQVLDINVAAILGTARKDSTTAFNRIITVNGSQTVDVRWRVTNNTVTLRTRTIHLIRIS